MKKKIIINMLSSADKVPGQGVGSAYLELVRLLTRGGEVKFDIRINAHGKADINHFHTVDPQFFLKMKASKAVNVVYCHFLPDTLDGSIRIPRLFFGIFKRYVTAFYRSADYLVVVNPIFKKELERYGIKKERMVYIPNYVSKTAFYPRPAAERMQLRQQYGIAENAFVVLGVGQVQTRKGVMDFVETARLMPDVTFIWAGGFSFGRITDGYEKLKRVVEDPPRNVRFLGIVPRDQMNDIFNLSDVLFVPSYNELFPMAILEAVNLHLPLVLRDLDLYEDILFHQYMACADNAGFARALRILKEDPHEYQKYVSASSALSKYYSQEHVRAKWEEFYQRAYRHGKW